MIKVCKKKQVLNVKVDGTFGSCISNKSSNSSQEITIYIKIYISKYIYIYIYYYSFITAIIFIIYAGLQITWELLYKVREEIEVYNMNINEHK